MEVDDKSLLGFDNPLGMLADNEGLDQCINLLNSIAIKLVTY